MWLITEFKPVYCGGEDPKAHLDAGFLTAQDLPVPSPFKTGYEAYATGSESGWGGSPLPDSYRGQGAWGSPSSRLLQQRYSWQGQSPQWGGYITGWIRHGAYLVVEEDPSQGVVTSATTVLAWGPEAALLWTSSQSFDLQSRHK